MFSISCFDLAWSERVHPLERVCNAFVFCFSFVTKSHIEVDVESLNHVLLFKYVEDKNFMMRQLSTNK